MRRGSRLALGGGEGVGGGGPVGPVLPAAGDPEVLGRRIDLGVSKRSVWRTVTLTVLSLPK